MLLGLWAGFFEWGGGESPSATTGGIADYRKYKKQLHAISKAAEKRLFSKVEKKISKLAKQATPEIVEIVNDIKTQINFDELAFQQSQEINAQLFILLKKLDKLVNDALILERQREDEEELILIMAAL